MLAYLRTTPGAPAAGGVPSAEVVAVEGEVLQIHSEAELDSLLQSAGGRLVVVAVSGRLLSDMFPTNDS